MGKVLPNVFFFLAWGQLNFREHLFLIRCTFCFVHLFVCLFVGFHRDH